MPIPRRTQKAGGQLVRRYLQFEPDNFPNRHEVARIPLEGLR